MCGMGGGGGGGADSQVAKKEHNTKTCMRARAHAHAGQDCTIGYNQANANAQSLLKACQTLCQLPQIFFLF